MRWHATSCAYIGSSITNTHKHFSLNFSYLLLCLPHVHVLRRSLLSDSLCLLHSNVYVFHSHCLTHRIGHFFRLCVCEVRSEGKNWSLSKKPKQKQKQTNIHHRFLFDVIWIERAFTYRCTKKMERKNKNILQNLAQIGNELCVAQ